MAKMVTFTVEVEDEDEKKIKREITAKSLAKAPFEVAEAAAESDLKGVVTTIRWGLAEDDYQWFRKLPGDALEPLMEAWEKASAVKLGE